VGRRTGLDAVVKRKIPSPCRKVNPRSSRPWSVAITTELSRLLARMGEMINTTLLSQKHERRRPLGRPRRRWEDNVTMDLREIGWEGVDWMRLAQDGDQ